MYVCVYIYTHLNEKDTGKTVVMALRQYRLRFTRFIFFRPTGLFLE